MKIFKMSILLLMAFMAMAGAVSAAPTRIASITDHINGPFRVAVDASGNLYVAETQNNLVVIYSSEGGYLRSFSAYRPLGIAVDAARNIYVGSYSSGRPDFRNSVEIYNADLVHTGSLGIGNGEISYPNDIAVSSDGRIVYVVDSGNALYGKPARVKSYDLLAGSSSSFGGTFKIPNAIAVNDTAGVIYVADSQLDSVNGRDIALIQVFSRSGAFIRSFSPSGAFVTLGGAITEKIAGIAVDSAGLLYVTTSRNCAYILDANGSPAAGAAVLKDTNPVRPTYIRNATGVAASKNGLVYVVDASSDDNDGRGRVDVFALDGYVTMAVDPLSLAFAGKQYAGNPDPQTIIISNTSGTNGGTLNWSATADQIWITLDASQGSVGANSASGLPVRVDISSFGVGTYTGTITIDPGFGQMKTVNVTVSVVPATILNISNGWLNFTARAGTTPAPQLITIGADNLTGNLNWGVTSSAPSWLSIAPGQGIAMPGAPSTQSSVSVNTAGLPVGSYTGLLTVSAPGAIGTNSNITVNLTITPSSRLSVRTNLASARFTVSGPATYSGGSGTTWSVDNAPAGQYTVTFDPVTGYKKPVPQTRNLIADGATTFTASYVSWQDLAARKNIVAAKGPDAGNDSRVNVFKPNGTGAAAVYDLTALGTRFGANVAVGDVDGDGSADLIVGAGLAADNPALVRVYRVADNSLITSFTPFASLNGVKVAAGDLNGDGNAEVVVSTPANGGELAVYTFENGSMVPTGITLTGIVLAVTADTEGDGLPEIVTTSGLTVKIWKIDLTGGIGSWTSTMVKQRKLDRPASSMAAADVNGDGNDEIIFSKIGTASVGARVVVLFADGTRTRFKAFPRFNFNVAAADLDGDGISEIIVGKTTPITAGQSDEQVAEVRVYSATGVIQYPFTPFENLHGGTNITVGDLGL